jgi:hypothetical protein
MTMAKPRLLALALVALVALALPGIASAADRDHDHMRDSWEKKFGLNTHKNDARRDKDRDGLKNIAEFKAGTNPRKADTDGDGTKDGDENAGKVASFDSSTGTLTITLAGGGTLTGKVDSTTEIECEGADDDSTATGGDTRGDGTPEDNAAAARHGADDGPGDDNGGDNQGGTDDSSSCGTEALTTDRVVKEADISGDGSSAIFQKVELAG